MEFAVRVLQPDSRCEKQVSDFRDFWPVLAVVTLEATLLHIDLGGVAGGDEVHGWDMFIGAQVADFLGVSVEHFANEDILGMGKLCWFSSLVSCVARSWGRISRINMGCIGFVHAPVPWTPIIRQGRSQLLPTVDWSPRKVGIIWIWQGCSWGSCCGSCCCCTCCCCCGSCCCSSCGHSHGAGCCGCCCCCCSGEGCWPIVWEKPQSEVSWCVHGAGADWMLPKKMGSCRWNCGGCICCRDCMLCTAACCCGFLVCERSIWQSYWLSLDNGCSSEYGCAAAWYSSGASKGLSICWEENGLPGGVLIDIDSLSVSKS